MFHIVHSPRFALLAPIKPTFVICTSDQMFGYSSLIRLYEAPDKSFGGNRRVLVHISFYSVLGSCGFMFFGYNPG